MDMGPCFGAVQRYPGKYLGLGILFLLVTCRSPQACSDLFPSHLSGVLFVLARETCVRPPFPSRLIPVSL